MNYNITDFNNSGSHFYSGTGSGLETEEEDDNKVAKYIALSFLICFASIIVICIILLMCHELCRKVPRINYHNSDRYSIYSYNSNFSSEFQTSINNTINKIRKMGKETITDKVSEYFDKIINPIYDDNLDKCAICLEKIDPLNKDDEPCTLNCNHTYHKRCISEYVLYNAVNGSTINCPLCRENINIV